MRQGLLLLASSILLASCVSGKSGHSPVSNSEPFTKPIEQSTPVHFTIPADAWTNQVVRKLMPFWMSSSALGKSNTAPFPTYRCRDGKAYGEPGCDLKSGEFKALSDTNINVRKNGNRDGTIGDGPYEWLTGPQNELLRRSYIRMHSRQTYAYGVAFHLTGDPHYLALAHRGVNWLLAHAIDKQNGSYTFYEGERAGPAPEYRTSQDQSYTMLGLAFYYYLTRDEKVLNVLTDLKEAVKRHYMSKDWEEGRLIRWMLKNNMEPHPTCYSTIPAPDRGTVEQKELVALLDQINAYMLLTAMSVPPKHREAWLEDAHLMAKTIQDRFFNDGIKSQNRKQTGIDPVVPAGMFAGCLTYSGPPKPKPGELPYCQKGQDPPNPRPIDPENCDPEHHHTDFGHSIKSLWMLYLIGRETDDTQMRDFAISRANNLLTEAYLDDGTWGRSKKPAAGFTPGFPKFDIDRDKEWWIYAELDQMSATMALREPATHVPRLNTTYSYWNASFLSNEPEVDQWEYDNCPGSDDMCPNKRIPKGNLWKNAFHSTEHGLVAYITTSGVEKKPAILYYALTGSEQAVLQPYYYRAMTVSTQTKKINDAGVSYRIVQTSFSNIQ